MHIDSQFAHLVFFIHPLIGVFKEMFEKAQFITELLLGMLINRTVQSNMMTKSQI